MKIRALLAGFFLAIGAVPVSEANDLERIFNSYSRGAAGTYDTSQGRYFYGGNFTGRIRQTSPNMVSMQAPSLKAGCNGIDFFAGSFNIVSGEEIVQMARGIAQGAAPYFFNMAVQAVCPSCFATMENLSQRLEELNKFAQTSCQNFWDGMSDATGMSDFVEKRKATATPLFEAELGLTGSWSDAMWRQAGASWRDEQSTASDETLVGNAVFRYLKSTYPSFIVVGTDGAGGSAQGTRELVMSLVGTAGVQFVDGNYEAYFMRSKITASHLIKGTESAEVEFITCDEEVNCNVPRYVSTSYTGLIPTYLKLLAGDAGTQGIFEAIRRKQNVTPAQMNLIISYPFGYVKVAETLSPYEFKQVSEVLAVRIAGAVVDDMYSHIIGVYRSMLSRGQTAQDIRVPHEMLRDLLDNAIYEREAGRKLVRDELEAMNNSMSILNSLTILNQASRRL